MAARSTTEVPRAARGPTFNEDDLRRLIDAKKGLENPGLTARITAVVGRPLELALGLLPERCWT